MDSPERRVLRRKKPILVNLFDPSDESFEKLVEKLVELKSLKKADADLIKVESSVPARVGRLLEVIDSGGFDGLCSVLSGENESVADELWAELHAERGTLEVEEYVQCEASVLVHREFGASKRLAEVEKSKLSQLVALRTQVAKEVWRKQLEKASESLAHCISVNEEKDAQARRTLAKVERFLEKNSSRLKKPETNEPRARHAQARRAVKLDQNGVATVQSPVQNADGAEATGSEDKTEEEAAKEAQVPVLEKLRECVAVLMKLAEECASERELLTAERTRALNVLNVTDHKAAKLEPLLRDHLTKSAKDLKDVRDKVKSREDKARDIEHRLHTYWAESEKTIESKDDAIVRLNGQCKSMQEKLREQQYMVVKLEQDLRTSKSELRQYKERTARLERNRRLGYLSEDSGSGSAGTKLPSIRHGRRRSNRGDSMGSSWQTVGEGY